MLSLFFGLTCTFDKYQECQLGEMKLAPSGDKVRSSSLLTYAMAKRYEGGPSPLVWGTCLGTKRFLVSPGPFIKTELVPVGFRCMPLIVPAVKVIIFLNLTIKTVDSVHVSFGY